MFDIEAGSLEYKKIWMLTIFFKRDSSAIVFSFVCFLFIYSFNINFFYLFWPALLPLTKPPKTLHMMEEKD